MSPYRQSVLQLSKLVVTTMSGPPHTACAIQYTQLFALYTCFHMKQCHIFLRLHKGLAKRLRTSNQQLVVTTVTSNLRNALILS